MANAAISTLINNISTVVVDATASNNYQDELYYELARLANPKTLVQTGAAFIAATRGATSYTLPSTAPAHRTGLIVFYSDTALSLARYDEAHYFDPMWKDSLGKPVVFLQDTSDRDKFFAIPAPDHDGQAIGGATPITFTTWPAENFTVISAVTDLTYAGTSYADTHLAVAFEVIARELARDSDHMDLDAAALAKQMADFFWTLSFPKED